MADIVYIRSSSLPGWPDCARRSAARSLRKEVEAAGFNLKSDDRRSIAAAVGTGLHKGASVALEEKAKTGVLAPLSVCEDAAAETLQYEASLGEMLYDKNTPQMDDAKKQVARMTKLYLTALAPDINPVMVEQRLEATVAEADNNGNPCVVLTGQPDQVCQEKHAIIDTKSGAQLGNHNPQVGSYSLLARTHGLKIERGQIDFIPRVSMRKPQAPAQRLVINVGEAEAAAANILRHIQNDIAVFREGDPMRGILPGDPWAFTANPSSKLCSEKFCPAYGTNFCREWRDDPVIVE